MVTQHHVESCVSEFLSSRASDSRSASYPPVRLGEEGGA